MSDAQTRSNQDTAGYNAALGAGNTFTPFGSSTFTQRTDPTTGAPIWDQRITLSEDQQRLLDAQSAQDLDLANLSSALVGQARDGMGQGVDLSRLPGLQQVGNTGPGVVGQLSTDGLPQLSDMRGFNVEGLPELLGANDLEGARKSISDALYSRQSAYLDPQYERREDALRSRLAAQGVTQNSEAWNNAFDEFNRGREFSYGQARDSAISGGGAELERLSGLSGAIRGQLFGERAAVQGAQADAASNNRSQLFGEREAAGSFQNSAQAQALSEALARISQNNATRSQGVEEAFAVRNQPFNELSAIRGMTQVNSPQFEGAGYTPAQGTDVSGNVNNNYNARLNIWNAQQMSRNGLLSGLLGLGGTLGGAAIAASDRRLKENIVRIGTRSGLPLYAFSYKGGVGGHIGHMADEVREVIPEAVIRGDDGYDLVDYAMLEARHGQH